MQTRLARWPMVVILAVGLFATPAVLMAQATTEGTPTAQPASDPLALLKAIPADATAFLAIRNLKELDADIVGIAGQLGFPMGPEGMFPAPLEWLKSSLMITGGLNEDDGVAVVLLDCQNVKTMEELPDRMVMFIPATDPKELLKSLNGEETTGGLYKLDLAGAPSVAIIKGNYVVAAKAPASTETPSSAALAAVAKAEGEGVVKTMAPDRVQAYGKQDLFIWLNLKTVSEDLRKGIADGMGQMMKGLTGRRRVTSQPDGQPGNKEVSDALGKVVQFIEEGEEVSVGLLLNPKVGLCLSLYYRVGPDTKLAELISAQQPGKGSLLAGLPNEAGVIVFGTAIAGTPDALKEARKLVEDMAAKAPQLDPDPGSPLTPEGLKPLIDSYISLLGNATRIAVMVSDLSAPEAPKPGEKKTEEDASTPAAKPAEGTVGMAVIVETKDNKAFKEDMKKIFDEAKQIAAGVAKADGMEQAKLDKIMSGFVWQENPGTADIVRVELDKMPDVKPEDLQKIKSVLGPEGITLRIATVGEKYVVVEMGGGDARLTEIKTLLEKNQAPISKSKNIAKIASRLPSSRRVAELYLDLGNLLEMAKTIANRLEMPLPFNISLKNSAPLAMTTVSAGKTAQQVDILVPIELIRSGYTAVTQAIMGAAMGGGGGQGGGPVIMPEGGGSGSESQPKPAKKARRAQPKPEE